MSPIIESTKEASKGVFKSIRGVRGIFLSQELIDNPFTDSAVGSKEKDDTQFIQFTIGDAVITDMADGEPAPELKEDKFVWTLRYAKPGRKPSDKGFYMRGWVASFEEQGITPSQKLGKPIVIAKKNVDLGFKDSEKKQVFSENFVLAGGVEEKEEDVIAYAKTVVVGKVVSLACRDVNMDNRLKYNLLIVAASKDGSLGELLGLEIVDGKYVEKGSE